MSLLCRSDIPLGAFCCCYSIPPTSPRSFPWLIVQRFQPSLCVHPFVTVSKAAYNKLTIFWDGDFTHRLSSIYVILPAVHWAVVHHALTTGWLISYYDFQGNPIRRFRTFCLHNCRVACNLSYQTKPLKGHSRTWNGSISGLASTSSQFCGGFPGRERPKLQTLIVQFQFPLCNAVMNVQETLQLCHCKRIRNVNWVKMLSLGDWSCV